MSNSVAEQFEQKSRAKTPVKQVRLKLVYLDLWSAVKFSFLLSLSLAIVGLVANLLIYIVLMQTGVLTQINDLLGDVAGSDINLLNIIGIPQVFGFSLICGLLNTIVGTALGAVIAIIYNMLVRMLGGFQMGFTSN